jgi:predicted phosphodiesterase
VKIAVISDLHLGTFGKTDLFGHDDFEFLRFLDFLESNFERVVLLGDVWETLTGPWPGALRELASARDCHREIAARFRRPIYTYVYGNHDWIARRECTPEEVLLESDGVRVLFTHGHQNEWLIERARLVAEFGVWIGAWIRRAGLDALYLALRRVDEIRQGRHCEDANLEFQLWALRAAEVQGADVVVTGHTHIAARDEHGSRLFMNSGSCSEGETTFLSLDTRSGRYAIHHSW